MSSKSSKRAQRSAVFKCRDCGGTFGQRQDLWDQIKEQHGPIQFRCCRQCYYRATRFDTLARHYSRFHPTHEAKVRSIPLEPERPETGNTVARVISDIYPLHHAPSPLSSPRPTLSRSLSPSCSFYPLLENPEECCQLHYQHPLPLSSSYSMPALQTIPEDGQPPSTVRRLVTVRVDP